MNIISNNCAGAECYKLTKNEYNNPFMWTCIFATDMIKLISNYHRIRWDKLSPIILTPTVANSNHYNRYKPNIPGLTIDGIFTVYFTHYLYDPVAKTPTRKGVDIYYYKNYEIGVTKYCKRVHRMLSNTEPPHFLVVAYDRHGWNVNRIEQLMQANCDDKITLITDKLPLSTKNNISVIYERNLNTPEFESPRKLVETYLSAILC